MALTRGDNREALAQLTGQVYFYCVTSLVDALAGAA